MALEFPDNPAQGQKYTGDNGISYTWTGKYWAADDTANRYVETSGDTMTGNLTMQSASIVFKENDDTLIDLNGTTGDITAQSYNTAQQAGFRNQIINGNFLIWQRGESGSLPAATGGYTSGYTADRMRVELLRPNGSAALSWEQCDIADTNVPHNTGIELTVVGTDANGYQTFGTSIENAQSLPAGEYTLSFWATGASVIETRVTAWYGTGNSGNENFVTQQNTLTSTWTQYTVPVTITDQRAKTNTPSSYISIQIILEGDNLPHTAGTFKFTGIQFEPGPVATPYEIIPIQTQLANCQRYCIRFNYGARDTLWVFQKYDTGTAWVSNQFNLPVPLRVFPTITYYNTATWNIVAGAAQTINTYGLQNDVRGGVPTEISSLALRFLFDNSSFGTPWELYTIRSNYNDPADMPYFILSSEF